MTNVTRETAEKVMQKSRELFELAEGTDLIAPNFMAILRVIERNALPRWFQKHDKNSDAGRGKTAHDRETKA